MDCAAGEEGAVPVRGRHIKKRALRNKSVSLSFNEKDLNDFLNGFHKRKKKRRREALQQQQEAEWRKLIVLREKRKLERDFAIYGGAPPPDTDMDHVESDEDVKPGALVSGTTTYDNGEVEVTVTTSEITRQEVYSINSKPEMENLQSGEVFQKSQQTISVGKKKQLNKGSKTSSRGRARGQRDKSMGKKKMNRH